MELWINELWLFLVAVIYTIVGMWMGQRKQTKDIAGNIIDNLIEQGYLMSKGTGKNLEILKHKDWCNDQSPR